MSEIVIEPPVYLTNLRTPGKFDADSTVQDMHNVLGDLAHQQVRTMLLLHASIHMITMPAMLSQ